MRRITAVLIIALGLIGQTTHAEGLSKKETRAIGAAYEEAWNNGDYEKLSQLYLNPDQLDRELILKHMKATDKVRSQGEEDGHIRVMFEYNDRIRLPIKEFGCFHTPTEAGDTPTRWLLITSSGKIKYDYVHIMHPIELAYSISWRLKFTFGGKGESAIIDNEWVQSGEMHIAKLQELGIPTFGMTSELSESDFRDAFEDFYDWLNDSGDEWDSSEPKVYLPKELMKLYRKRKP